MTAQGTIDSSEGVRSPFKVDWTVDPETGRPNSSAEYLQIVQTITGILEGSFASIFEDESLAAASNVIAVKLAHSYDIAPKRVELVPARRNVGLGNLFGYAEMDHVYRYEALHEGLIEGPTKALHGTKRYSEVVGEIEILLEQFLSYRIMTELIKGLASEIVDKLISRHNLRYAPVVNEQVHRADDGGIYGYFGWNGRSFFFRGERIDSAPD